MPKGATATRTLAVGDRATDFHLNSHLGIEFSLNQWAGKKNVFIAFYPLDWTPV